MVGLGSVVEEIGLADVQRIDQRGKGDDEGYGSHFKNFGFSWNSTERVQEVDKGWYGFSDKLDQRPMCMFGIEECEKEWVRSVWSEGQVRGQSPGNVNYKEGMKETQKYTERGN